MECYAVSFQLLNSYSSCAGFTTTDRDEMWYGWALNVLRKGSAGFGGVPPVKA